MQPHLLIGSSWVALLCASMASCDRDAATRGPFELIARERVAQGVGREIGVVGPTGVELALVGAADDATVLVDGTPSLHLRRPDFSARYVPSAPDGATLTLVAQADDGRESPPLTLAVDRAAPAIVAFLPPPGSSVAELTDLTLTFSDRSRVDFFATEIDLFIGDRALAEGTDFVRVPRPPDTLVFGLRVPLDGALHAEVRTHDSVGNVAPIAVAYDVAIDHRPPDFTVLAPAPGAILEGPFALTVTAANDSVALGWSLTDKDQTRRTGPLVQEAAGWSATIDPRGLLDGPLVLTVTAVDGVQNIATQTITGLTLAGSLPELVRVSPPLSAWVAESVALKIEARSAQDRVARVEARAENGDLIATILFNIDGIGVSSIAPPPATLTLVDAAQRRRVIETHWHVDTTPPEVRWLPPPTDRDGIPLGLPPEIDVALFDAESGPNRNATLASLVVTPPPNGRSGLWQASVIPVDLVGNAGPEVVGSWTVDGEAPAIIIDTPPSGTFVGPRTEVHARATDNDRVADAGATARDAHGMAATQAGATLVSGEIEAWLDLGSLTEGPVVVSVQAHDRAGLLGQADVTVALDRTAPTIAWTTPSPAWIAPTATLALVISDAGAGATEVRARRAGDAISQAASPVFAGQASLVLTAPDGAHGASASWFVSATDAVGNTAQRAFAARIDRVPPVAVWNPVDAVLAAIPTLTVTLSDEGAGIDPTTCELTATRNGIPVTEGIVLAPAPAPDPSPAPANVNTFHITLPDTAGRWQLRLVPHDEAGLVGTPADLAFAVDRTPPTVAFPAPAWVGADHAAFALSADDDTAVATIAVTIQDPGGHTRTQTLSAPPWQLDLDLAGLDPGPLAAHAVATDLAGHTASADAALGRDLAPPIIDTATAPSAPVGHTFTLDVTAHDDASGLVAIEAWLGPTKVGASTFDPIATTTTPLAVTLDSVFASGPADLRVVVRDAVGLEAEALVPLRLDLMPPTATFLPTAEPASPTTLSARAPWLAILLDDGPASDPAGLDQAATLASLTLTVDGLPAAVTTDPAAPDTLRVTASDLADRDVDATFAIVPIDRAGNAGPRVVNIVHIDTHGPHLVLPTSPIDGASGIAPRTPLVLTFDEPLAPGTPGAAAPVLATADGHAVPVAAQALANELTVHPANALAAWPADVTLAFTLTMAITDRFGNPVAAASLASTPAPAPAPDPTPDLTFHVRPYRFLDLAADLGLSAYRGGLGEPFEDHGPGGAFVDLDEDGYPDLALAARPNTPLVVYRNVPGPTPSGRALLPVTLDPADDATPGTPLNAAGGAGLLAADFDNDGDRDLFATRWNGDNSLYTNQFRETGTFTFRDTTALTAPPGEPGLAFATEDGVPLRLALTAAAADVDRDGRLDLYVGHHNGNYLAPEVGDVAGERSALYLQNPDGTFHDATWDYDVPGWVDPHGAYTTPDRNYGSSDAVVFADLNNDRWPDLLVSNKVRGPFDRDMLYLNRGADAAGHWLGFRNVTYELAPTFGASTDLPMGLQVADMDHDGDLDIYVTDWAVYGVAPGKNQLWLNQLTDTGALGFVTAACCDGVYSWGSQLQDFDHDGTLDIHVATNAKEYDLLYMGGHAGAPGASTWGGFIDMAEVADVRQRTNARGDLAADLDRDGWLDLVVVNLDDAPRVFWNVWWRAWPHVAPAPAAHWLGIDLIGAPGGPGPYRSTRDALGARVLVTADTDGDGIPETLSAEVAAGSGSATSTSDHALVFGLGAATDATIDIRWPSGADTHIAAPPLDHYITVDEAADPALP